MAKDNSQFTYKANERAGEFLLANDSSLPAYAEVFDDIDSRLKGMSEIEEDSHTCFYPSTYEEEEGERVARANYRRSDFLLPAAIVDEETFEVLSFLLVDRINHNRAFVLSYKTLKVLFAIYNGWKVVEEVLPESSEVFLDAIGMNVHAAPTPSYSAPVKGVKNLGYAIARPSEDEEEEEDDVEIEVARPAFEASSKKGVRNLGVSFAIANDNEEEEEDDDDLVIPVARPSFSAFSSKKPRNLDDPKPYVHKNKENATIVAPSFTPTSSRKPRTIVDEKPTFAKPSPVIDIEEEDAPLDIKVQAPKFTPASHKKPRNLNARPLSPKPSAAVAKEKTEGEAVDIKVKKPAFIVAKKPKSPNAKLNNPKPVENKAAMEQAKPLKQPKTVEENEKEEEDLSIDFSGFRKSISAGLGRPLTREEELELMFGSTRKKKTK